MSLETGSAPDCFPFVFAVTGVKNSGKTTLICRLVRLLKQKGLRVNVIKHDGHDFEADVPGTDSYRMFHSGADGIVIYSPEKYMAIARSQGRNGQGCAHEQAAAGREARAEQAAAGWEARTDQAAVREARTGYSGAHTDQGTVRQMASRLPAADVLILEGFKDSTFPKIEIVRRGVSDRTVSPSESLMAIATDLSREDLSQEDAHRPLLDLNDPGAICEFLLGRYGLPNRKSSRQKPPVSAKKKISVKTKVMLSGEEDFFGPGIARLLENIDRRGSIHAAAVYMNMSYSKAWKLVNRAEDQTGILFLNRVNGGKKGGSSTLTPEGRVFLQQYELMQQELHQAAEDIFRRHFGQPS